MSLLLLAQSTTPTCVWPNPWITVFDLSIVLEHRTAEIHCKQYRVYIVS